MSEPPTWAEINARYDQLNAALRDGWRRDQLGNAATAFLYAVIAVAMGTAHHVNGYPWVWLAFGPIVALFLALAVAFVVRWHHA